MRNVSHLPPASAISALAKAAPPLVTLAPCTMMVAPWRTPASSSVIELHRLLAGGDLRAEEHGREAVERDALGAIDHRGRQIFVAQANDPSSKYPCQRRGTGLRPSGVILPERLGHARLGEMRQGGPGPPALATRNRCRRVSEFDRSTGRRPEPCRPIGRPQNVYDTAASPNPGQQDARDRAERRRQLHRRDEPHDTTDGSPSRPRRSPARRGGAPETSRATIKPPPPLDRSNRSCPRCRMLERR